MSLTCALLIAASVFTGVQAGLVTKVYQNFKTRQSRRETRWKTTEPRAIPAYMLMSEGSYYTAGRIKEKSKGGSYYTMQSACDGMGDGCWGFQTTAGCSDRLGCGQFLILKDPGNAKKLKLKGTRVYAKKTYTWDVVPLQCTGLIEDEDAETVGECEENCSQDLECEIYQWYDDETCSRGKSNMCHGNKQVVEGYRARPVFWSFTPTQCDGLKYDSTADGNLEQCQYNCQWDATCDMYEFRKTEKCWRGQGDDCESLTSLLVDNNGKKDEKFKWKNLQKDCSGLTHDEGATTADECKQNCADSDCSIWQFKVNGQCWNGHASECSPDKDLTVEDGGYRWYINNGDSEEDDTDDEEISSNLCPDGYVAVSNNLDGSGKKFTSADSSRTIEDCKDICDAREGCTSFEFASGTSKSGGCGTYTDGWDNVKSDDNRLFSGSNWRSCLKDDDKSFNKICPDGYKAISNNLDGSGKEFAPSDSSRTIEDCKDICDAREGCTSFEFASGSKHSGGCGTYTDGSGNVKGDESRLSKGSNWRSCLKEDVTTTPVPGLISIGRRLLELHQ